jgi:hypothetical protein
MPEAAELERLTATTRCENRTEKAYRLDHFQFSPLKSFYIEVQTYKKKQSFSRGGIADFTR